MIFCAEVGHNGQILMSTIVSADNSE